MAKETKAPEETIIQEGTREYHGKFVIKKTDKGHFVYKLFAYGNKCVAIGAQAYEGLSGVKGGIASVAKIAGTAPIENQTLKSYETLKFPKWEIYADKKGEFRLRLYASNGNLVATTNDGYLSVQAAKKGIESVAKAADGSARCPFSSPQRPCDIGPGAWERAHRQGWRKRHHRRPSDRLPKSCR